MSAFAPFKQSALRNATSKRDKASPVKKSISISGMFKVPPNKIDKDYRYVKAQVSTKKDNKKRDPKPPPHPLSVDFNGRFAHVFNVPEISAHPQIIEVSNAYQRAALGNEHENLDVIFDELINRLGGIDGQKQSNPVRELASIKDSVSSTIEPLADHTVKVRFRNADGTIEPGEIPLGETVSRFESKLEIHSRELRVLWAEWETLQRQIIELSSEMLHEEENETDDAKSARFEKVMEVAREEIEETADESIAELEKESADEAKKQKEREVKWTDLLSAMA